MAKERVQKTKQTTETKQEVEEIDVAVDEEAEKLKAETDALLDEIDGELADNEALWADIDEALGENLENAQEFVANFLQKGGQ